MYYSLNRHLKRLKQDDINKIAKKSYRHPNGFIKIVLETNIDGSTTQLHYFERSATSSNNPHDNGFDFTSKVLVGVLKDVYYNVMEGTGYTEYNLDLKTPREPSSCSFRNPRPVSLKSIGWCYNFQGMKYSVDANAIHSTECLTPVGLTIVRQNPRIKDSCNLYVKRNKALENDVTYDNLTPKELVEVLRNIIRLIDMNK